LDQKDKELATIGAQLIANQKELST
jgi:hypothetical protein